MIVAVRKRLDSSDSKSVGISTKGSLDQAGHDSPVIGKEEVEGGERVDQIRDILFGAQRQDYEKRFSRLEELLVKNISELSNETTNKFTNYQAEYDERLTRLEELLVKNVSELNHEYERKLNSHKSENYKSFQETEGVLKKAISDLKEETGKQFNVQKSEYSQKLSSLEENLVNVVSDFRKQLDSKAASLLQDIDRAKSDIHQSLEYINLNKVDRSNLAGFLHNMAASLENKDNKMGSGKK